MRRASLLFGVALLAGACAQAGAPRSVLLITLDTTRADRIGCYGRADAGTENIDALAARGLFFTRALTPVPITLPAHTSLMTASPPPYHGVRDNGAFVADERLETLAESFSAAGFSTAAFVSAFPLTERFGLDQGFDVFEEPRGRGAEARNMNEERGDVATSKALAWLGNLEPNEPFFVWVHLFDPHFPYEPPAPFDTRFFEDPYQGEIAFADQQVGRLLDALDKSGRSGSTLVALTADHGESLGEHGELSHSALVYDGTLRVPLVLAGPGVPEIGAVEGTVGLVDLAPTLLELAGLEVGDFVYHGGRSLVTDLRGGSVASEPVYFESVYSRLHYGWSELYGVEEDGWKYTLAPGAEAAELFDVRRGEAEDLLDDKQERGRQLAALLAALRRALAPVTPFESRPGLTAGSEGTDTLAALEALGYVGIDLEAEAVESPGLDPRRAITAVEAGSHVRAYLERGDLESAQAEFELVRAIDPDGVLAAEGAGMIALKEAHSGGAFGPAVAAFARATELSPGRRALWAWRAEAEIGAGELEAALASCSRALALAPPTDELRSLWKRLGSEVERRAKVADESGHAEEAARLRALAALD
jgi:arylsulfatase A-like enzyme